MVFMPLCNFLLWLWAVSSNWQIEYTKSDGMLLPGLVTKGLWLLLWMSSLTSLFWRKSAAILWDALWRGPHGNEERETSGEQSVRNWSPQCNSSWGTESCHQHREWGWKQIFSQLRFQMRFQTLSIAWLQLHERPWGRSIQLSHAWIPDTQKLWDNKCLCF